VKNVKRNALSAVKTTCKLRKMTGSNVWAAEIGCTRSVLRTTTNASTAVGSYCKIKQQDEEENFVHCNLDSWVHLVKILCTYIYYFNVDIASLLWIKFNSLHSNILLLEFTGYFLRATSLHIYRYLSLTKSGVSKSMSRKDAAKTVFFLSCISETFIAADVVHAA